MKGQELLLAVDGGGTKTQALVTDLQGKVLARGLGPSSNLHNVGFEPGYAAITTAVEGALVNVLGPQALGKGSGWRGANIAAACFGLAGVDAPEDEVKVSRWVREQTAITRFRVVNDSELILAGGTPDGWGVALISGTGSVALGRSADGRTLRVGGWGQMLGDEGSGYDIAMRAMRRATQAADGRAEGKALMDAILRHWSLREATALIHHVHGPTMTPSDIAGLASVVLDLAAKGDAPAQSVIDEAARDLALHVDTIVTKLHLAKPPLALAGGMLRAHMRRAVIAAIKSEIGPAHYVADPALGAVVLARRLLQAAPAPR